MKVRALIAILAIGVLTSCNAQEFDKEKLDAYFDALANNNQFMGSVAVSRNGEIIYTRSVGHASIDAGKIADKNSKYRIGSISKTFTAALTMKAVEEKKLSLDETIGKFFPSITNGEKVTIRDLLSHRSGIHNFTDSPDYFNWNTQSKTQEEMIAMIANAGSDFEPDSKSAYSNSNYVLLTIILERTFGKPYTQLLTEHIAKPLGLGNTGMGGKIDPSNNECESYRFAGSWQRQAETHPSVPLGAGAIISTPSDLVTFAHGLFGGRVVDAESLSAMKTIRDNYGLGLIRFPFHDKIGFGHNGGIDGFSSLFGHFPDGDVAFAITSNGTVHGINDIAIALLSAAYNKPFDIPEFTTYKTSAEELDQYTGTYSSTQLPLKITVTKMDDKLMAQATGQSAFPLEPTAPGKFRFTQAGIVMEFDAAQKTMVLKQGGGQFLFSKE